uniref:CD80-like immunoglobulin C2-set domain-containing protein n=1 Tax=Leptobrachium leishanense TaxID=445787 RepID=A0A8C5QW55_9ANUR
MDRSHRVTIAFYLMIFLWKTVLPADMKSFSICSRRKIRESLSLNILDTEITDTGRSSCEVLDDDILKLCFELHVSVRPSVSLTINPSGFPECLAVGGKPAADISWSPKTDNVTSRREMEPEKMWTVISTYHAQIIHGREVTCIVSHPTFTLPQILTIVIPGMSVVFSLCVLFKIQTLICTSSAKIIIKM